VFEIVKGQNVITVQKKNEYWKEWAKTIGQVTSLGLMKVFFIRSIPWDSAEFLLKMTEYRDMRSNVWRSGSPICRSWE
jgi:hypothetical protein